MTTKKFGVRMSFNGSEHNSIYSCTSNLTKMSALSNVFGYSHFLYTKDNINKAMNAIKNNQNRENLQGILLKQLMTKDTLNSGKRTNCTRRLGKRLNFLSRLKQKHPLFGQGWIYKKGKRKRGSRHVLKKPKKVDT